jgi:hypothetical protein
MAALVEGPSGHIVSQLATTAGSVAVEHQLRNSLITLGNRKSGFSRTDDATRRRRPPGNLR